MSRKLAGMMKINHKMLQEKPPKVAVLPWGATEAHSSHLPYGSDVIEAYSVSKSAAELALKEGAAVIVYPAIPFGNNAQQLDQHGTIHLSTATALGILRDVADSLTRQGIDRLIIVNSHGGNNFQPLVRDLEKEFPILVAVADLHRMIPERVAEIFDNPGDHAGQLETSFMMHLKPESVHFPQAGEGKTIPFRVGGLNQPGVWTPRPWSHTQPDLGSGNPAGASPEKGRLYVEALCEALKEVIVGVAKAKKGELPYV